MIDNFELWSSAHVNFATSKRMLDFTEYGEDSDTDWLKYQVDKTPNGSLLINNAMFDCLSEEKVYLAHITSQFNKIKETKKLLSSSGCLIGSLYCVPVIKDKSGLRLHNLGRYIYKNELPAFKNNEDDSDILLIEINNPLSERSLYGIDYLKLGLVHYSTFRQLNYLLSLSELDSIKNNTVKAIQKSYELFLLLEKKPIVDLVVDFEKIYSYYLDCIETLPILGYLLFEVLSEYIALYQQGPEVDRYKLFNELYCNNFKNLILEISPHLTKSFNLGYFNPTLSGIKAYLEKLNLLQPNDEVSFESYFLKRIKYLIRNRFYNIESNYFFEGLPSRFENDFDKLSVSMRPLVGHTIHRLMRNMHRYPNFYFYFDQYKALQAWNHWNQSRIPIVYNALLPKGEIGINAAYPDLEYKIYKTKPVEQNGDSYLTDLEELDLKLQPRLAEIETLIMRKR